MSIAIKSKKKNNGGKKKSHRRSHRRTQCRIRRGGGLPWYDRGGFHPPISTQT